MTRRLAFAYFVFVALFGLATRPVRAQVVPSGAPAAQAPVSAQPGPAVSQNSFSGSVPSKLEPGVLQLSLKDAIARGLKQNLGVLLSNEDVRAARGTRWQA